MYTDLLCSNNNLVVNIKLAKIVGLEAAVYCSEVLNVIKEVVRKKKYDVEGFFKLDRRYIEDRTTLTVEEQVECDAILGNLGLLEVAPEDTSVIRLFSEKLFTLLIEDNLASLTTNKRKTIKATNSQKSAARKAGMVETMQKITDTFSDNTDVQRALRNWAEVIVRSKVLTKAQAQLFWDTITNFTSDVGMQIALINTAMANAYANADWVINSYCKEHKIRPAATTLPTQQTATEDTIDFTQTF